MLNIDKLQEYMNEFPSRMFVYVTDVYGNPGSYKIPEDQIPEEWESLGEVFGWSDMPEDERPTLHRNFTSATVEMDDGSKETIWFDEYVDDDGEVVYREYVPKLFGDADIA